MHHKALVATENRELCQKMADSLWSTCLKTDCAATYFQAVNRCSRFPYILAIRDPGFSEIDGIAGIRRLRQLEQTPILAPSAHNSRSEEMEALNAGADSYLAIETPLDLELCPAHAFALMRRYLSAYTKEYASIRIAGISLKVHPGLRKVFLSGKDLKRSPKQFALLHILVEHIGEVVAKEGLYQIAWPEDCEVHAGDALKFHAGQLARDFVRVAWMT